MANNDVSQYFKTDSGLDISSDSQFTTLSANQKIVYKPNSEKYEKNPNYSNVFDKVKSFATDEELSDTKSKGIATIDDANENGECSCKNANGTQIDTFTCHIPVSNNNSSLNWSQQSTIGYVDGKALTINMPAIPNAGTGLALSGTTFNIDEDWLKTSFKTSFTMESLSTNSIPFHNAYPRCKYLGSRITDAQNMAIKNRTYDDLFIGDYWTINGINWRIVAIEYYYSLAQTIVNYNNQSHILVMPDTNLYSAVMNGTRTTAGGYGGSLMRNEKLNRAYEIAQKAFGNHLAQQEIYLTNAVDASGPCSYNWYSSHGVELPNEVQIFGTRICSPATAQFGVGMDRYQFPLMAVAPRFAVNVGPYDESYWLQDVYSRNVSECFVTVGYKTLQGTIADNTYGVRPVVTLTFI